MITADTIPSTRHDVFSGIRPALKMPVLSNGGQTLGTVASLHHDAATQQLTGLSVRFGFLGHKHTLVRIEDCGAIRHDMVELLLTASMFERLPICDAPVARILQPDLTWSQ